MTVRDKREVRFHATELTDATVRFISLVKHGANRQPIKATKSRGSDMNIDLSGVFTRAKSEPVKPAVVAIIVNEKADQAAMKKRIEAAGFKTDAATKADGIVVYKQSDVPHTAVLKVSDDLAVAFTARKGFEPYDGDSTDFTELMATEGVFPAISTAFCVLSDVIYNTMWKSDSPEAAASLVESAFDACKAYCLGLISGAPSDAFKLDKSPIPSAKSDEGEPVQTTAPAAAAEEPVKPDAPAAPAEPTPAAPAAEPAPAQPAATPAADAAPAAPGASEGTAEGTPTPAEGAPAPVLDTKAIAEVVGQTVTNALKTTNDTLAKVATRLDAVEAGVTSAAKKADEALTAINGTVPSTSHEDREQPGKKGEGEVAGDFNWNFDTALDPSIRGAQKRH